MIPQFRSSLYTIFRVCERFGILPPDMKPSWDEMGSWQHALLLGYQQVVENDECKWEAGLAGAKL